MPNWFNRIFRPAQYEQAIKQSLEEERVGGSVFAPAEMYRNSQSAGVNVSELGCLGISPLYRALDVISGKAASLDREVIQCNPNGTRTILYDHPVNKVLNVSPNDLYGANTLIGFLFWNAVLHGNGLGWIKSRDPLRIYGISPQHTILRYMDQRWVYQTTVYETKDGDVITAAINTSQVSVSGATSYIAYIPFYDMLHLRGLGDMLVGYSLLDILKDALGEQVALQRYSSQFFANGCRIGNVVEAPPGFNPNDPQKLADFRRMWESRHMGPNNAGRTAILPNGAKAYQLGMNNEEIQWSKARESMSPMVVSQLTGVPVHLLGVTSGSSQYKNEEEKTQSFLQFTMSSWFDRFENEAFLKLLTEAEKDKGNIKIKFCRKQLIQHDVETVDKINQAKLLSGRTTINELLMEANQPGIGPDGDERFLPTTVQTLDTLIEPPEPPAPVAPPGAGPAKPEPDADDAPAKKLGKARAAVIDRIVKRLKKSVESRKGKDWDLVKYHRDVLVEAFAPFNPDSDVIVDALLPEMAAELRACLSEQFDWVKLKERLTNEI